MTPLGPDSWDGLPIYSCRQTERLHLSDVELPHALLVLWNSGGSRLDVRRSADQHWHVRVRVNRFDLYAAGQYEAVSADAVARDALVVRLAPSVTGALLGHEEADLTFGPCRFQFADRTLERLVRGLAALAAGRDAAGPHYVRSLSAAIVERLLALEAPPEADTPGLGDATRSLLVDLVDRHLAKPPTLEEMALMSGKRTAHFLKAFKRTFGMTPHQLVLERRIRRAEYLLERDVPLTAVALELGFASHAHFTATFRARTGRTPSAHRRSVRSAEGPVDLVDAQAAA